MIGTERPVCRSASGECNLLTAVQCHTHQSSATAALRNTFPPPKPTKTSPKSTRPEQSESNLRSAQAGALGGSSGRLREVWMEKEPPPKGGSFSIQGLPFPHFVSSSSTSSANISATVGLCSTGFGVTSPALIKAHLVRDGPTNS